MSDRRLQLIAMSGLPALDARRGLVRISAEAMTALGVAPWDVVHVTGGRTTAVLVAKAAPGNDPRVAWCDDLTLANAQVRDVLTLERAPLAICRDLVLSGPPFVRENVDPLLVRTALLGKPVTVGDQLSLLSQDYSLPGAVDPQQRTADRLTLHHQIGQGWDQITLSVAQADPAGGGIVAPNTRVSWHAPSGSPVQQPGSSRHLLEAGLAPATVSSREAADQAFDTLPLVQAPRQVPPDPFHRPGLGDAPITVPGGAPSWPGPGQIVPGNNPSHSPPGQPVPGYGMSGQSAPGQSAPGQSVTGTAGQPAPSYPSVRTPAPMMAPLVAPPGLAEPTRQLTEWLDLDFHRRDLLARLGATTQLGVLISAPSGVGCADIIAAACDAVGAHRVRIWAPELLCAADPGIALAAALTQAQSRTPCVLVIDDIEELVPAEGDGGTGPAHAMTMRLVEEAVEDPNVAVICTTRKPERVHRDLRAEGRLDRELVIHPPDEAAREVMLAALTSTMPLAGVDLAQVAARTTGYVLADLQGLVREAATRAAFRARDGAALTVTVEDFGAALDVVRPSTAEGRAMPVPDVTLDDVGNMEHVKQVLTEVVLWPLAHPETFARLGVAAPAGVLLYGPPGCGKTHIVRALAGSGRLTVFAVKGAELLSKWVGESERAVRELFRTARASAPALVFLDEVDALAPVRGASTDSGTTDRVVAALLTELDGIDGRSGVVVVGATNRIDRIDPAVLRAGRLERHVEVPRPDAQARALILRAASRKTPLDADVDLTALAARTDGYSAADCDALVREAALAAMRESMDLTGVAARHFDQALAAAAR